MSQPSLFDTGPADTTTLTDRLALAHRILAGNRDGMRADELGAAIHDARGLHRNGGVCSYCANEGRACARSLEQRGLASRDKHGVWRANGTSDPGYDPGTAAIPF
jgi:hypothetical protein